MPLQATSGAASYDAFGGGVPVVPNYIEDVFSTYLYQGASSTPPTITNGIDLAGKGGMVWIKARNGVANQTVTDTVRGSGKEIYTNQTWEQQNYTGTYGINSFNADGFSLIGNNADTNTTAYNYASWTFRKQPKFFDVVTYTGDITARTISHSLGSVPGMIIVKQTSGAGGTWWVYHRSLGATQYLSLDETSAAGSAGNLWNSSEPTSTVFSIGANANVNANGQTYVAYLFAHNAGGFGLTGTDNVISCGSFTTDSGSNATITLGYEPQWVMVKAATTTSHWNMIDIMRGDSLTSTSRLLANNAISETVDSFGYFSPTATGMTTTTAGLFPANQTFIYIAIRRGPMKVPTSGTSVFYPETRTGTGATTSVTGIGFAPDLVWPQRLETSESPIFDKLRGAGIFLNTSSTSAEQTHAPINTVTSFNQNGYSLGNDDWFSIVNNLNDTFATWNFKRAPSFFDEVCYTGDGADNRQVIHNLGVTPELVIVKPRSVAWQWWVYHTGLGNTRQGIVLNSTAAKSSNVDAFSTDGSPFSSSYFLQSASSAPYPPNANGYTYVAYLFATCAGVSKVGSYTGTATTKQIDCGFTSGARFVLIKRTDSTGDWYVWDSARGIVSGNDPYILINVMSANITNTDYIDIYSAGFEISSSAPSAINASGGTFIFLAIA